MKSTWGADIEVSNDSSDYGPLDVLPVDVLLQIGGGTHNITLLSPKRARKLARKLLNEADRVDRINTGRQ